MERSRVDPRWTPTSPATFFVVLLGTSLVIGSGGVRITELRVPPLVRNGSGRAVLLDCVYTLDDETEEQAGLVVKWFLNSAPAPVYQWIPKQPPQDLGVLRGRLNLEYRASSHASSMHRALHIVSPSTELSGDYKCSVSTFHGEDFAMKKMLVFAPEKRLEIGHVRVAPGQLNVTCLATGVFPEPRLTLFKEVTPDQPLEDASVVTRYSSGAYDVEASVLLQDPLESTTFHCELRIPEASYAARKSLLYIPGSMDVTVAEYEESDSSSNAAGSSWLHMTCAIFIVKILIQGN